MNAPLPDEVRRALESVTLDDKYSLDRGRAFMSGVQALVRLPMLQRLRDAQAGLNTAGFISGYRGSPLGTYDQSLWAAKKYMEANNIVFQPGVNEELGATTPAVSTISSVAVQAVRGTPARPGFTSPWRMTSCACSAVSGSPT